MTTSPHSDNDDIIVELVKDHDELREMFGKLRGGSTSATSATGDERARLVREMTVELVKHSVAEEVHLYPLIRKVFDDGDHIADHEIDEHAQVERLLKELEKLEPTDAKYDQNVQQVIDDVTHHAQEEETEVFPRLRQLCKEDELRELGDKVRRTKSIAPTHPHPSAPDTPPGNLIAGPLAGLVDRVRDAFSSRT
jgi:hemerythrin superfamily protein